MSIQPLPPDVIAQIKSSITITSLNGVICELVKNSLDAASTKIEVSVDYTRGGCVVEDDGLGIQPSEFGENGGLGKLYHTSKLNSQTPVHGGRGAFLAALSAMALMSITSHHHLHRSHNTINMHKSEVLSRQTPAPPQQYLSHLNHGTRVTIRDLFGNMPVRVKQRAIAVEKQKGTDKAWEELRRETVLLLVSWPRHVTITVREKDTNQKLAVRPLLRFDEVNANAEVEISRVCSILSSVAFISPNEKTFWVPVGISTPNLDIRGTISLQPSALKHIQFISFGIHPVKTGQCSSLLHDEINRLFVNSSFGNEEEILDLDDAERARRAKDQRFKGDGYTNKELKRGKKGVYRWPMFYINIQQHNAPNFSRQMDPDGVLEDAGNKLSTIIELLQVMVTQFLSLHHFRPKASRGHRSKRKKEDETSSLQDASPNQAIASLKRPQVVNKSILKNAKPSFDLLGTNIKIPLFRRTSSKPESLFEGWSRIKSGAAAPALGPKNRVAVEFEGASISRPSSAPPLHGTSSQHFSAEIPPQRPQTPLIAKNGKLLRKPFDDVIAARSRSKAAPAPVRPPETARTVADGEDDFVEWINPVTKVRSMVNRRTGLTMPAKNEIRGRRLSTKPLSEYEPTAPAKTASKTEKPLWISDMLQKWDNPVFSIAEPTIPQVLLEGPDERTQSILHGRHHHCSQLDIDRAFKESSAGVSSRISKTALRNAEVISQVDQKFILIKVQISINKSIFNHHDDGSILVLIDQHAADERIRIESLMEELCSPPKDDSVLAISPVLTTPLNKPLIFEISLKEIQVLKAQISYFANWGILYELATSAKSSDLINAMYCLSVRSLPPGIIERCRQEPRLLIELIRTEAWKAQELGKAAPHRQLDDQKTWLQHTQSCPQGILDLLNSRACRGAIMFNDELSKAQCETLVTKLADCIFPFQCAHGRPSLVPLVDVGTLKCGDREDEMAREQGVGGFGKAFKKWSQEQYP